jgi:hypothetical protein
MRRRVLAMTLFALTGCGAATPAGDGIAGSFGRMAGYVWNGQVTALHAAWTVPAILQGSPPGHGSTWIGAQAPGPSNTAPFIQVGVVEDRVRRQAGAAGGEVSRERAFWSDTILGFHPHFLWPVSAGDRVEATLTRGVDRWRVAIFDVSTGERTSFTTADEAHASFGLAEWLQEDATRSDGGREPYPKLSETRFEQLTVNGGPPRYADVSSQWMSLPATDLAPTALRGSRFSVVPATLSAAGARYLQLAARAQRADAAFEVQAVGWRTDTPSPRIAAACSQLALALRRFEQQLHAASWPTASRPAIATLIAAVRARLSVLRSAIPRAVRDPGTWTASYETSGLSSSRADRILRRLLHVPELSSS